MTLLRKNARFMTPFTFIVWLAWRVGQLLVAILAGLWWLPTPKMSQGGAAWALLVLVAWTFNHMPAQGVKWVTRQPEFLFQAPVATLAAVGFLYGVFAA